MSAAKSSPRILLVGGTGQVGYELLPVLSRLGEVTTLHRRDVPGSLNQMVVDLQNPSAVRQVVRDFQPQVVVNAVAYTAVDRAEDESEAAYGLNASLPAVLAEEVQECSGILVHFSTDYVFDGSGERPWKETDAVSPLNVYGRSKLAGEDAIRKSDVAHLILRTSWVYGVHGNNFVKTIARLAKSRPALQVVSDQIGAPTSATFLAQATGKVLETVKLESSSRTFPSGTYHLCCSGEASWYDFAREVVASLDEAGEQGHLACVKPTLTRDYPTRALRPLNSRLDCSKVFNAFDLQPLDWRQAFRALSGNLLASLVVEGA